MAWAPQFQPQTAEARPHPGEKLNHLGPLLWRERVALVLQCGLELGLGQGVAPQRERAHAKAAQGACARLQGMRLLEQVASLFELACAKRRARTFDELFITVRRRGRLCRNARRA
jgi:hypothetical protein